MRHYFLPNLRYERSCAMGTRSNIAAKSHRICISGLWAILYCLIIGSSIFATTNTRISGKVQDSQTNHPIQYATVSLENTDFITITDSKGEFYFSDIPPDQYTIRVSSVGYNIFISDKIHVTSKVTIRQDIRLTPKVQRIGSIKISAKADRRTDIGEVIIDRQDIVESRATDLSDVLESVDGLRVTSSGPNGSRSEISIRGSSPDDVLILVDGQRVNSPSDGTVDLSSIPTEIIERIEIIKGGAGAVYGPDALSGAINIVTQSSSLLRNTEAIISRQWSKWNSDGIKFMLAGISPDDRLSAKVSYMDRKALGDFKYEYAVQPENEKYIGNRNNNEFSKYSYFISGYYRVLSSLSIRYSGQLYRDFRGLPGPASQPSDSAYSIDSRLMGTLNIEHMVNATKLLQLILGYSRLEQKFNESSSILPFPLRFDNQYINDILNSRLNYKFKFLRELNINIGGEYRHEKFDHQDILSPRFSMNESSRNNWAFYLSSTREFEFKNIAFFDYSTINGSLRYDYAKTSKDSTSMRDTVKTNSIEYLSPRLNLSLSKKGGLEYTLFASYGRAIKVPPITALFWQSDARAGGNPGLKPEKSEQSEIGLETGYEFGGINLNAGITYFHSSIRDIIVWMPLYGGWTPVNRNLARITGHGDFISIGLFNNHLTARYNATTTLPLNRTPGHNSFDKDIPFSPSYSATYTFKLNLKYINASYTIRKSGKAYTNEANTKYYDSYRVDDISTGTRFTIKNDWQINIDCQLNNIHDKNYVLIAHYPMPGFEWGFSIGLKYAPDSN